MINCPKNTAELRRKLMLYERLAPDQRDYLMELLLSFSSWSIETGDILQITPECTDDRMMGLLLVAFDTDADTVLGYVIEWDQMSRASDAIFVRVKRAEVAKTGGKAQWDMIELLQQIRESQTLEAREMRLRTEALMMLRGMPDHNWLG